MTNASPTLAWLTKTSIPNKIINFWSSKYNLAGYSWDEYIIVYHMSDPEFSKQFGPPHTKDILSFTNGSEHFYYFDGQRRTEKEMLKIIDLLVFL